MVKYTINGKTVAVLPRRPERMAEILRSKRTPGGHLPACWPRLSDALGVHPEQIPEATAAAAADGVPTRFVEHGKMAGAAIIESPRHQRDLCRTLGMHDRNASYSGCTPDEAKSWVESKYGPEEQPELL